MASRRLRRAIRAPATTLAVVALGLCAGGCSYELGSLFEKDNAKTGVARSSGAVIPASNVLPTDTDLAYASAAAADVLTKGGKGVSAPWENPRTGARGTVTPIAAAYSQDGSQCREFLASYVVNDSESWLTGEACRMQQGRWVVRSLKPWQRARDDGPERAPSARVAATDS
jgi:surface antigen